MKDRVHFFSTDDMSVPHYLQMAENVITEYENGQSAVRDTRIHTQKLQGAGRQDAARQKKARLVLQGCFGILFFR